MLKTISLTILYVCLITLVSCSASHNNGFDEVCHIFQEAKRLHKPLNETLSYITDNINKRVKHGDAHEAFTLLVNAIPSERYTLFKQTAEASLKHTWDCPDMNAIMTEANKSTDQK